MISHSQAAQDLFVEFVTNNKFNGTFLEIGSNDPISTNNSYLFESKYNWKGIMVEYDKNFKNLYNIHRPNSIHVMEDARIVNYREVLDNNSFPENMDYLQIDLDVNNRSTLDTCIHLNNTVFDKYKFASITFEHDIYTGNYFNTREICRNIFLNRGYILVFPDVSVFYENSYCPFEDWYVHPDLVDMKLINKIISTKSLTVEEIKEKLLSIV
jgi:hypothetical protein